MVDNRCANSDYALDVDEMILEYLLYNTTKEHLYDFRSHEACGNGSRSFGTDSAASLLQAFDQFMELFKLNHPRYEFSPHIDFNIKLLQFMVLFTHRRSPEVLSPSSRDHIRESSRQNSTVRAKWWNTDQAPEQQGSKDKSILDSWHGFFPPSANSGERRMTAFLGNQHVEAETMIFLLELLPTFLDLSADMAANLGQDVTGQWMSLAAEFMLQSAWEKYVNLDTEAGEEPLKSAFGWGPWAGPEHLENALISVGASLEIKAAELRIDAMFDRSDGSLGDAARQDIPEWPIIRLNYLSAFGTSPEGWESSKQAQRWQVERLRQMAERLPIKVFDGKVMDYLEGLWKLGRKPILVQIEEGKIDGMAEDEFEEFMENVFPKGSGTQEIGQGGRWWN